jgi:eukaryotic-like serine/threonine-protein kinase
MSGTLDRLAAALADRYRIERELGQGGMATVYLAEDLRHKRRVAVKVLKPELAAVLGAERFVQEIRTTAALQHPHILPLFDSGTADGFLFYVMPFIDGETLRSKLDRETQLGVEESVRIATDVADALHYAHSQGVIHRDIKPENVLLRNGRPMVADFGIALAVAQAGGGRFTQTGISLGTPQYMSPEQATGDRAIDARSDIYSLGALTYEMLVGAPPHVASTSQAVLAKLLTETPQSVRAQRPNVPEHVDLAVLNALERLPADRFATAGEFAEAVTGVRVVRTPGRAPGSHPTGWDAEGGRPGPFKRSGRVVRWAAVALVTGLVTTLAAALLWPRPPSEGTALFQVMPPTAGRVARGLAAGSNIAVSPDGSMLAFVVEGEGIFVRRLEEPEARLLRGAERGEAPSFSPSGAWLLFRTPDGDLARVPAEGGGAVRIGEAGPGASWLDEEHLLVARDGALWRAPLRGGEVEVVARPDPLRGHRAYAWPYVLPGGRAALVALWKEGQRSFADYAELAVVNLADGVVTELGIAGTSPRWAPSGHLVFVRADGSVYGQPLSLRRLRPTGAAVRVLEDVSVSPGGTADLAISNNGTLFYLSARDPLTRLVTVDRLGAARPLSDHVRQYSSPRVSPDGRRVALSIGYAPSSVWTLDVGSGALTRVTGGDAAHRPEWTPDGERLAWVEYQESGGVSWRSAGGGVPERILTASGVSEVSFGPPGTFLAIRRGSLPALSGDIWIAPLDSPEDLRPFAATSFNEAEPRVSPDGRLLAYMSEETQRPEVYVALLPGPGTPVQVSLDGGSQPVWSADGRELFYRSSGRLMAATLARSPELAVVRRDTLFVDHNVGAYSSGFSPGHATYDVTPAGDFVMLQPVSGGDRQLFVVLNWFGALRRNVEAGQRVR